jgi:hypothetical protein
MTRHWIPIVLVVAVVAGAPLRSTPIAAEAGKALLLGTDTSKVRVLFRTVDDGPLLWVAPTKLGTKVSLLPGHHELTVMCEFKSSGMTQLVAGRLSVDVEEGHIYTVAGALDGSARKCDVSISARP